MINSYSHMPCSSTRQLNTHWHLATWPPTATTPGRDLPHPLPPWGGPSSGWGETGKKWVKTSETGGKYGKTMGNMDIYIYTYLYGKTLGKWWFIQEKQGFHGIFLMPLKLQFWRVYTTHENNLGMVYCWVTHELLWLSWRFLNLVNEIGWIRAISRTSIQGWI